MIYWILLVVTGLLLFWGYNLYQSYKTEELGFTAIVIGIISLMITIALTIIICVNNFNKAGQIQKIEQTRSSLVYQLDNNLYDNDNDFGKKELYNQIQKYNEDLAYCKTVQKDFWVGIFYPNIFDEFDFIDL